MSGVHLLCGLIGFERYGVKLKDKRIDLLENAKITKAVNQMAMPAIIGLMVLGIYNFVDTMFVSWLGTEATGATQVVMPIMMLVSSFGLAFGIGGGSYISRLLGMKQSEKANEVGSVAFVTAIIVGIIYTISALVFIEPLLSFFGASSEVMELAKSYGMYIILGSMFTMGNMTMNNMLRAEGSGKLSMIGMTVGAVLNIALDPLFIFTFGLGISGAAMATVLSQIVTFTILISRYLNHHSVVKIGLSHFKPNRNTYMEIFKVGIPTFVRQLLFSVSLGILNQGANTYGGPELLAAVGIIFKTIMVPMYVVFGIGQGFQPVAGYNVGAGNHHRVMASLRYSIKLSLAVAVISSIGLIVFDEVILSIFRPSEDVLDYCILGLRYYGVATIIMAVSNTIGVFYQALGKGFESLVLSVARQGLFFIPAIIILPKIMNYNGILGAQLLADILTLGLSFVMIVPFIKSGKFVKEISLNNQVVLEGE